MRKLDPGKPNFLPDGLWMRENSLVAINRWSSDQWMQAIAKWKIISMHFLQLRAVHNTAGFFFKDRDTQVDEIRMAELYEKIFTTSLPALHTFTLSTSSCLVTRSFLWSYILYLSRILGDPYHMWNSPADVSAISKIASIARKNFEQSFGVRKLERKIEKIWGEFEENAKEITAKGFRQV